VSVFGEYLVVGTREYRGHKPGETFEAELDRFAEERAITRGDIRLLKRMTPGVQPGSYTFPDGWLPPPDSSTTEVQPEAPKGASSIGGGG